MSRILIEAQNAAGRAEEAKEFCAAFCADSEIPKYVFGRNVYAQSVAKSIDITGFVDDFTQDSQYLGRPILRSEHVPQNALVLVASGGRPLTARGKLNDLGLRNLDYFAFSRWSGLPLTPVVFNEGFAEEFVESEREYQWIYDLLADEESKRTFEKLVSFRLNYDIGVLEGFTHREDLQYFEDFLGLNKDGEIFVDVGGFNGYTSLEFIRRCPGYRSIHLFEPDPENFALCVAALNKCRDVHIHKKGLSNTRTTLRLSPLGSGSRIGDEGELSVDVDRLDDVLQAPATFIKMDIEGAELDALAGAEGTIRKNRPKLAMCVYHNAGDFWRIPKKVLSLYDGYQIYLRHYTESIYETVMFFVPR